MYIIAKFYLPKWMNFLVSKFVMVYRERFEINNFWSYEFFETLRYGMQHSSIVITWPHSMSKFFYVWKWEEEHKIGVLTFNFEWISSFWTWEVLIWHGDFKMFKVWIYLISIYFNFYLWEVMAWRGTCQCSGWSTEGERSALNPHRRKFNLIKCSTGRKEITFFFIDIINKICTT